MTDNRGYTAVSVLQHNRLRWNDTFLANVNLRSRSLYAVAVPSVCLSVTSVRPTQPVEIFRNFSSPFGTSAIR